MPKRARRQFTDEYKAEAVSMVRTGGKTLAQVARDLDLTESSLRIWVERAQSRRESGSELSGTERQELVQLRKENRVLRMERELLKKRRPSSPRSRREVRVHPGAEGPLSRRDDVSPLGRLAQRLLRLLSSTALGPPKAGQGAS